jgi:hypothetical protein
MSDIQEVLRGREESERKPEAIPRHTNDDRASNATSVIYDALFILNFRTSHHHAH